MARPYVAEHFHLTPAELGDRHALVAKLYYWYKSESFDCWLQRKVPRGTKTPGGRLTHAVLKVRDRLAVEMCSAQGGCTTEFLVL